MITFGNFFHSTIAAYTPAPLPYREPDFVSHSGSAYWDLGDRVIRSSDHWLGQGSCTGQASCLWSYSEYLAEGTWATGVCLYRDFRRRQKVPVMVDIADSDRLLALRLQSAGGAIIETDRRRCGTPLPVWARRVWQGSQGIPAPAQALFARVPQAASVIYAPSATIETILSGVTQIQCGFHPGGPEFR